MQHPRKRSRDISEIAAFVVRATTEEIPEEEKPIDNRNPHAVAIGRLGGLKGGKARADKLTGERRKEIAKKAAETRWSKTKHK